MTDSDDELLAPDFLLTKTVNELLTSKKRTTGNSSNGHRTGKTKFSLSSLLMEKKNTDVIHPKDVEIDEMRKEFDKQGDFTALIDNNVPETSLQNENLIPEHRNRIAKMNSFNANDFPDLFPGEEIFILERNEEIYQESLASLFKMLLGDEKDIEQLTATEMEEYISTALLTGIHFASSELVYDHIWKLLVLSKDDVLSEYCFQYLTDDYCNNINNVWCPSVTRCIEYLYFLGAEPQKLSSTTNLNNYNLLELCNDEVEFLERRKIRENFKHYASNLSYLLKLFTYIVQRQTWCTEDFNCLLVACICVAMDHLAQLAILDIVLIIGHLLDAYSDWDSNQPSDDVCKELTRFHHHNLLHVASIFPPTARGMQFKQLFSLHITCHLLKKPFTNLFPITPVTIQNLILDLHISDNTDYYELNTIVLLLETALHTDDIVPSQKGVLSKLINKIRLLNGEIKECQGRFLDRTKVKDVLLRFATKLTLCLQNLKTQCHLDEYFNTPDDVT